MLILMLMLMIVQEKAEPVPLSKRNLDIRVRVGCLTWASRNYKFQSLNPLSRVLINLTPLSGAVSLNHWHTVGHGRGGVVLGLRAKPESVCEGCKFISLEMDKDRLVVGVDWLTSWRRLGPKSVWWGKIGLIGQLVKSSQPRYFYHAGQDQHFVNI